MSKKVWHSLYGWEHFYNYIGIYFLASLAGSWHTNTWVYWLHSCWKKRQNNPNPTPLLYQHIFLVHIIPSRSLPSSDHRGMLHRYVMSSDFNDELFMVSSFPSESFQISVFMCHAFCMQFEGAARHRENTTIACHGSRVFRTICHMLT